MHRLQEWYGQWLSGIFVDESVGVADDNEGDRVMCSRYKGYREHVQKQIGESATVRETSESKNKFDACPLNSQHHFKRLKYLFAAGRHHSLFPNNLHRACLDTTKSIGVSIGCPIRLFS